MELSRPSIEDQPPPYTQAVPPASPHPKTSSITEPLPQYPTRPPPIVSRSVLRSFKISLLRRYRIWILGAALLITAIIAAVLGYTLHARASDADSDRDPPAPAILALAAATCDVGTFVFHQDNLGVMYLQGSLRNGTWNNTGSPYIPKTKIEIPVHEVDGGYTPPGEYVMSGTNITAICWSEAATIEIRFYYISAFYHINEGSLSLSAPWARFPDYPSSLIATHHQIANITNPSSIAAVYHSTLGKRLYYLDSPYGYWDGEEGYKTANLTEISWRNDNGWHDLQETKILSGVAHDSGAGLAVVAVDAQKTRADDDEIHVIYVNVDLNLEIIILKNGTWGHPTELLSSKEPIKAAVNLAALISNINPTYLRIYYLSSHRPHEIFDSSPGNYNHNTLSFPSQLEGLKFAPDAIQYPPLVAATAWMNATDVPATARGQSMMQLFYVERSPGEGHESKDAGAVIVNITTGYESSWERGSMGILE